MPTSGSGSSTTSAALVVTTVARHRAAASGGATASRKRASRRIGEPPNLRRDRTNRAARDADGVRPAVDRRRGLQERPRSPAVASHSTRWIRERSRAGATPDCSCAAKCSTRSAPSAATTSPGPGRPAARPGLAPRSTTKVVAAGHRRHQAHPRRVSRRVSFLMMCDHAREMSTPTIDVSRRVASTGIPGLDEHHGRGLHAQAFVPGGRDARIRQDHAGPPVLHGGRTSRRVGTM